MSKAKKRSQAVAEAIIPVEAETQAPTKTSKKIKSSLILNGDGNTTTTVTQIKTVEDALKTMKKILQALEPLKGLSLTQVQDWCQARNIEIPWPADLAPAKEFCGVTGTADDLIFDFEAPQSVAIAGSFMLQSSLANGESNVDLIVEQPDGLIFRYDNGAKDRINWRYWLRRTFYLVVCYDAIKKALSSINGVSIYFDHLHDNPYKTIIVIKFLEGSGVDRLIRIIPAIPFSDKFKAKMFRLSPQRSNVRSNWLQTWTNKDKKTTQSQAQALEQVKEYPTPFYNYSLLSEALYLHHLIYLHSTLKSSTVLSLSIKMLKAWLKQSGISLVTSMNGFMASMWLVDMVNRNEINSTIMDELQIFKLVLKSWINAFGSIPSSKNEFKMKLSGFEEEFEGFCGDDSFVIPEISLLAGPMNLFYAANLNSLQKLSQRATSTLSFLSTHPDRLDRIFLTNLNFDLFTQDLSVEIKNVRCEDIKGLPVGVLQNYANVLSSGYLEGRIALVLKKGLTDRFKGPLDIKIIKSKFEQINSFDIKIGITFDSQNQRTIDLGPNSEDLEGSAKFRGFWGSKSELRQFKDSAIRECVSWEFVKDKSTIPKEIISWLFSRHFGLKLSCDSSKQLEFFNSSGGDNFSKFSGVFDELSRELRNLNQVLPLTIVQCVGLSPAHRHSSLKIPMACTELSQEFPSSLLPSPSCPVYDFLIRFERSVAWPDERQALQSARQAFLLQLNRTIKSRRIVEASLVAPEYIDIYYKGFVFRGWIEVPCEELRCRAEGLITEAESIERRTFWKPRLSNILHQINSRQSAFSETCRLIKSFLSGHLLNLDEDLIDVLSSLIFLQNEDQTGSGKAVWVGSLLQNCPVGSALTGFLRFLDLLINFPWNERPLILDFSSFDEGNSSITQIEIDAMKSSDWSALLRTSTDRNNSISIVPIFTREHKAMIINSIGSPELISLIPTLPFDTIEKITLIRCKLLARLTLEHLESLSLSLNFGDEFENFSSLQGLFKMSPTAICSDFDVLIKLDCEQIQQVSGHHIEGITRILRNSPQPSPLLFSALPGFSAPDRLVKELSGPLKALGAAIAYNPNNPILLAVRIREMEIIDDIVETIKKIGGDIIQDIKITRK